MQENKEKKCPVTGAMSSENHGTQNSALKFCFLNPKILHQNSSHINPLGEGYNYREEFKKLVESGEYEQLKEDLKKVITTPQDWWPADYRLYGGLMIRLAWHSAGSYRSFDGRGGGNRGEIRFPPRIDWPDNIALDKAIRLLWPVKKKYGQKISWADLIILAGNVSMEVMGFKPLGFSGGREDIWEPLEDIFWGREKEMLSFETRYKGENLDLEDPLAATHMGLIYVNPEGPKGNPDPAKSAKEIREIFRRMGMDDYDTVALIAGGHTFGKAHGAFPESQIGPSPTASPLENQGLGWPKQVQMTDESLKVSTSGFEGAWKQNPVKWDMGYLENLFKYEWELTKSPAGHYQWKPKNAGEEAMAPDPFNPNKRQMIMMLTADLALRFDPDYEKIARHFLENPEEFRQAFAKAWFKLTHRDMGPKSRYIGPEVPQEEFLWQEPLPQRNFDLIDENDIKELKKRILSSGLSVSELVYTAWSSAATYRISDYRGGANGARIRLLPQKNWEINMPDQLEKVLAVFENIQKEFNEQASNGKKVSIADIIVLGGCAAIEEAGRRAGIEFEIPFTPGRVDATQEQTDISNQEWLYPYADGFRNYIKPDLKVSFTPEELLLDRAQLLNLTATEMTALLGGMRVLNTNYLKAKHGVLTERPEVLSNDFFINLLDMSVTWKELGEEKGFGLVYEAIDRRTGNRKWTATRVDLIFAHNIELRSIAETYAADDGLTMFVKNFIKAWNKVMNADLFHLATS